MYMRASEYLDEPARARSRINASAILTVFYIVRRSSMTCVLLNLSMFSCIKPNQYTGKNKLIQRMYVLHHFKLVFEYMSYHETT